MTDAPNPTANSSTIASARRTERPPLSPTASTGALVGQRAIDAVAVAFSVALLSATVVLASIRVRADGDLDWSNFLLGAAATLGLLAVAVAANRMVPDPLRRRLFVAWPGAFGAIAAGLMLTASIEGDWTPYVSGILIVALSVAGYWFSDSPAFVVSAVVGLFVLYLQVTDDLFNALDLEGNENVGLVVGALLLVFALSVTAAGWLLPTRVYSGVVAGVIAAVGYTVTLFGLLVVASFAGAFDELGGASGRRDYDDDVWWILVFSLILVALWAFCAWVTGHVGFRLLMVGLTVPVVPLATTVLGVQHPSWWELILGLVAGGLLVAVAFRATRDDDEPSPHQLARDDRP
jgi:hypothetical protein